MEQTIIKIRPVKPYTVKTRIKEPSFLGIRLAKVLELRSVDRAFSPIFRLGEGLCDQIMVRNHFWWQCNLVRAILASSQNQFYSKWVVKFQAGRS